MLRIVFLLCLVLHIAFTAYLREVNKNNNYCYAQDTNPYRYVATKTAYEFVHGDRIQGRIPKCKPIQFWSFNRHGTRLPGKSDLKDFKKLTEIQQSILHNYENAIPYTHSENGRLCEQDIELFKNWKWNTSITVNVSNFLTTQGWQDEKRMALRNKARFPELLALAYSEKDFLFRHTKTERTESSFKAYAEGLFGAESVNIHGITVQNDTLIQTYKYCKFWKETVEDNPVNFIESNKLLDSEIYKNLINEVSERLGFNKPLKQSKIKIMYNMCRYEQAWYVDDKSAWCSVFTKQHLKILEYAEDLLDYYLIGHGTPLNTKVGCMPLQDMLQRFENVIHGDTSQPKGVFYFSHSPAIRLLITAMQMNIDEIPLKADNMNEQENRLWRTSFIGSFAANVDAILYKCSEGDEYRVVFNLNEKIYEYSDCPAGICSWDKIKEKFGKIAENCSLDVCKIDETI